MTSVPLNSMRLAKRDSVNSVEKDVALDHGYLFSIPPHLIKIRHIRSIWITLKRTPFEEPASEGNVKTSTFDKETDDLQIKKSLTSPLKQLRKGKSATNLNQNAKEEVFKEHKRYNNSILGQSNEIRQQLKLQKTNVSFFHDCFYSISNFMESDKPYYVSRVFSAHSDIADELNINILNNSASISLFIRHDGKWLLYEQYHIKLSLLINLGSDLQFLKDQLQNIDNLLILKLSDNCYYALANDNISKQKIGELQQQFRQQIQISTNKNSFKLESCSYDQIMTLNNFSRCIHDLRCTTAILSNRIANEIQNKENLWHQLEKVDQQINFSHNFIKLLNEKQLHNFEIQEKLLKLRADQKKLQIHIQNMKEFNQESSIVNEIKTYIAKNERKKYKVNLEKARIARSVLAVFPIELGNGKYDFSLFGTSFPSSIIPYHSKHTHEHSEEIPISVISPTIIRTLMQLSKSQIEKINALVGFIALTVGVIFDIFNIPSRYHVRFLGSSSYIHDYLSHNARSDGEVDCTGKRSNIYPLFICQNPTLTVKFTYGLFLLRKNIEQLYEVEGISKIEEFNLLTACKIWLTCVESYADVEFVRSGDGGGEEDDEEEEQGEDEGEGESRRIIHVEVPNNAMSEATDENTVIPLLDDAVKLVGENRVKRSDTSMRSTLSGTSNVFVEASINSMVNEYNHNFLSEERIKHIKKQLLRGISK